MNYAAVDFESYYDEDESDPCSITKLGVDGYVLHPKWLCYQVAIVTSTGLEWVGDPSDAPWDQIAGDDWEWIAQNAGFDERVYFYLKKFGKVPLDPRPRLWNCSADLCAFSAVPRALANAMSFLYQVKVSKDYRNKMRGVIFSTLAPEKQADVREAGLIDCRSALRLWNDLSPKWPEKERRISRISRQQYCQGLLIDKPALETDIQFLKNLKWQAEQLVPWHGVEATLSYPALVAECQKAGIEAPPSRAMASEECGDWLDRYGDQYLWVDAMRMAGRANGLLKKIETMYVRIRAEDGRLPYENKYFGAHCFPGGTEVLTREGWARLDQWPGGEIMQWTGVGLCFAPAVANRFEDTGEKLLRLKSTHVDCSVTQGHWMATVSQRTGSVRKEQAESIRFQNRHILLSSCYRGGANILLSWQARLIVAVQADGHYCQDQKAIRFNFKKVRKIDRLRVLLCESDLEWEEKTFDSQPGYVTFMVRGFPAWLENRKTWTSELLGWSFETLVVIRDELRYWDGFLCTDKSFGYATVSRENAEWVATLAHLTGWAATVTSKTPEQCGEWSKQGLQVVYLRQQTRTEVSPQHWTDVGLAADVFCPTAQHGACLFRSKGTILITFQTGRWGDGGENVGRMKSGGFNSRNLPRTTMFGEDFFLGKLKPDGTREVAEGKNFAAKCWEPGMKGINLRHRIIPAPGCHFPIADLSQIEPRVLWCFAGDYESLALVRQGQTPYEAHARRTMGYDNPLPLEDVNPGAYQLAKARVLALGYNAGWIKFIAMAPLYVSKEECERIFSAPVTESEIERFVEYLKKCRIKEWIALWAKADDLMRRTYINSWKIVMDFRRSNPKIASKSHRKPGLWQQMQNLLESAIGDDLELGLPSGRSLLYRKVARIEGDITGIVMKYGKPIRMKLYGGLLTENLCQAVARDVFVECLLRIDDAGHLVAAHVHDEAIPEVPLTVTAEVIQEIMSQAPDWMKTLPVASKCKSRMFYMKG